MYGTDAFSGPLNLAATPLVHLATIPNANLNFTRGLVWLEDVHYNGDKFNSQRLHTFFWDNLGFDGPVLPRDLGFDVPDNNVPDNSTQAGPSVVATDTGYFVAAGASRDLTVPGVTGVAMPPRALLIFNYAPPRPGHPDRRGQRAHHHRARQQCTLGCRSPWRTSRPVTISHLHRRSAMNVMNVSLIMQGAGGPGGVVRP